MSRADPYLATIRASILTRIVHALDAATGNADELLAKQGLSRTELLDPYAAVPLRPYVALLEAAATRLGDKQFGLRIGAMMQPADLGPAGLLLCSAPTLRQGLEIFHRYIATLQSATEVVLNDDGTRAEWVYNVEDPAAWPRIQDTELTLAVMCNLFRVRLGARWSPLEIHFEHTGSDRDSSLRHFFNARIAFGQPRTQIVMATVDLDRQLIVEGADVTPVLERHAQDVLTQQVYRRQEADLSITDRVRRLIGARLSLEQITVASVAREFNMSSRSLQRDLAGEGTSLRNLLREHRLALAEKRLETGASSHASIAQAMGYSDTTVFWRAFKRWSGASPSAFRDRRDGHRKEEK